jgi:hypothetical protein
LVIIMTYLECHFYVTSGNLSLATPLQITPEMFCYIDSCIFLFSPSVSVRKESHLSKLISDTSKKIDYTALWAAAKSPDAFIESLIAAALVQYRAHTPGDHEILELAQANSNFIFDASGHVLPDGEDRTILAWAQTQMPLKPRDSAYQRGYPIPLTCAGRALDRGHYIPYSGGGLFGPNMYPQDRALNRGWSKEGRLFRAIERTATAHAKTIYFVRPRYCDNSHFPELIDVGCLSGNGLQTDSFRNRFDRLMPCGTESEGKLLDVLLPSMTSTHFGILGEETAVVWLETVMDAIMVSLSDAGSPRPDHKNELDIVAIVGNDLVCYEVKTRLLSKKAGRLTRRGNLFAPRLSSTEGHSKLKQASQPYVAQRLDRIIDTDPENYAGVESRVITVDLQSMLIQEFYCSDDGRIGGAVGEPSNCRECAVEAMGRLTEYFLGR